MQKITFLKNSDIKTNQPVLNRIFKLREQTFKQRLDWEVSTTNGLERDSFDQLEVSHIAMTNDNDEVIGCWRALPTQGKYMLKDVFPELLQGELAPQNKEVWEISRFAIQKGDGQAGTSLVTSSTADLVNSFFDFAIENNIKHYVLVTTLACERILRLLEIPSRRMGKGKSMQIGVERSVALWIDVDAVLASRTQLVA
ncbi:GNAT family N-acetyltransferase [Shewanella sp. KX20019]|uniref:acyl-homoserine-lactone synthase n=1 Tax=Shewanella sp. KX20019 TaxID=2803864 RepID=UPI0019271647|nr:acyl-homoserine-lactone synthase [Shewanella sp. KX20019]QQX80927.1 GNAT family N-acetyltransferase [Shewanella sp. KX20019]